MIHLGEINIRDQDSVIEIRKKIHELARSLELNHVDATRLATFSSEITQSLLLEGNRPKVELNLDSEASAIKLVLTFYGIASFAKEDLYRPFFDRLDGHFTDDTPCKVVTIKTVPLTMESLSERFINIERQRISKKSRTELVEALRIKNQELEEYNARLEEMVTERTARLYDANQKMKDDLQAGANYVQSLIPPPMADSIKIDWRYIPSADLGGDIFDYFWIDNNFLIVYLLDVTGHGLDSALMSVSVLNVIRSTALPDTDFREPDQVLYALNNAFQTDKFGNKLFTIWYGVYDKSQSLLRWAGAGHPDALLYRNNSKKAQALASTGPLIGVMSDSEYSCLETEIKPKTSLYLYSDGVHEIKLQDNSRWEYESFLNFFSEKRKANQNVMDTLIDHVRELHGQSVMEDDFSIVEITF